MAEIKVLPKHMAELIAAGEVVERPASVIKELCENAIDAGATKITVEIQRGGITYMRVTDNGSGIPHGQVPTAFLRHATSKIKREEDLYSIGTLGFRGEALASVSSVSRVEMLTKTAESELGTRYRIEGGEQLEYDEAGCPDGTTIIVRDLFYNVPARMKFLKKDVSEAMAVAAVVDELALCNPKISVKLIKDSKTVLTTNGDGKLHSTIYSVLGRDFSNSLIPVDSETNGIRVHGMIGKPINCRSSRSGQYYFLNGRIIKSGAAAKAMDTAYKNSVMVGKFPVCVLFAEIAPERVDVNVHPAKTEVRFHDEKAFFEAIYYAAKNALIKGDTRPELELGRPAARPSVTGGSAPSAGAWSSGRTAANGAVSQNTTQNTSRPAAKPAPFSRITAEEYKNMTGKQISEAQLGYLDALRETAALRDNQTSLFKDEVKIVKLGPELVSEPKQETTPAQKSKTDYLNLIEDESKPALPEKESAVGDNTYTFADDIELRLHYLGEAFKTYIIVEYKDSIYFIDKHAAHERILFEKFKSERTVEPQLLLAPVSVTLSRAEHRALLDNLTLVTSAGFEVEEFGTSSVLVRAVPTELANEDIAFIICEVADSLLKSGRVENERLENLYHTVACRAAIKGGNNQTAEELLQLAKRILSDESIMYCPHGRPVAFRLSRGELEKQFGRTN